MVKIMNTESNTVYLNKELYQQEVKENLIRQFKAALRAHHQSANKKQNIEINLSLPGVGDFSKISGEVDIAEYLAPLAAQACKQAIAEFDTFNQNIPAGLGKLAKIRLVRRKDDEYSYEAGAIDDTFFNGKYDEKQHATIGEFIEGKLEDEEDFVLVSKGIQVTASDQLLEDLVQSDSSLQPVILVFGNCRVQAGNDLEGETQESRVIARFPMLRYLMCAHHNKAMLFNTFENDASLDNYNNIDCTLSDEEKKTIVTLCFKDTLQDIIINACEGIKSYDDKGKGFFSRRSTGGKQRAHYYNNQLSGSTYIEPGKLKQLNYDDPNDNIDDNLEDKLLALIALLFSNKGKTLQRMVMNELNQYFDIDPKSKNAHIAYAQELVKIVLALYNIDDLDINIRNHLRKAEQNDNISVGHDVGNIFLTVSENEKMVNNLNNESDDDFGNYLGF